MLHKFIKLLRCHLSVKPSNLHWSKSSNTAWLHQALPTKYHAFIHDSKFLSYLGHCINARILVQCGACSVYPYISGVRVAVPGSWRCTWNVGCFHVSITTVLVAMLLMHCSLALTEPLSWLWSIPALLRIKECNKQINPTSCGPLHDISTASRLQGAEDWLQ